MPRSFDIKFNAEERRAYLTSFSSKKKQRRAFGLAMQKVKDRREKLDQRKEHRKRLAAEAEEFNKINDDFDEQNDTTSMMEETKIEPENIKSKGPICDVNHVDEAQRLKTVTTKFVDPLTHANFGGEVIVTTTFDLPNDEEEDILDLQPVIDQQKHNKGLDVEQRFAGSVKKYLNDKLPSKKRRMSNNGGTSRKKGKHGAEGMKGIGSAKDLKLAQKTLNQAKSKVNHHSHGKHQKKNKGGKK